MTLRSDALVVGGGVIGCAVAYFLAREGLSVTLLERDAVGEHASGAAAGMLLPTGEVDAPGPFLTLAMESLALFPDLARELHERSGIDVEYETSGALRVARSQAEAEALRARAERFRDHGVEWIDAQAAAAAEPALAHDVLGALHAPREGHVRSALLARAFAGAAARLGAEIVAGVSVTGLLREGERITGVRTTADPRETDTVVLCMGAWAAALSDWLPELPRLPVDPVRGQILCLEPRDPPLRGIVRDAHVYLVPRRDGTVTVGATEEHTGFDTRVTAGGMADLLGAATSVVPALSDATFRSAHAGLRPATPDRMPVVGPVPGAPGLLLATGHYRNGVLLAPITARLVSEVVTGKGLGPDAAALRPERLLR